MLVGTSGAPSRRQRAKKAEASQVVEARLKAANWSVQDVTEAATTDAPTAADADQYFCLPSTADAPAPAGAAGLLETVGKATFHYFPDQCHVLSLQAEIRLEHEWVSFLDAAF